MKRVVTIFFLFCLISVLGVNTQLLSATRGIKIAAKGGQQLYLYKDYQALVVGVSDYERWPDLPNAVKDAREVSELLKGMGFKVSLVTDPTSQELKKALSSLAYQDGLEADRALFFYYAGHGETETLADSTKLGYIIPRDCPLLRDDPQGFINRAVSMKDIEAYSLRIRSKHVLMLFDSCFSGSLFSLVRAVPEDISEKSTFPVRQYITAGREDEAVPDRSMFKRCLLLGLQGDADLTRDGYITGSELGLYLSDKVVKYTRGRQHPQYGKINNPDLDRGDFIFVLAKSGGAVIEKPGKKATLRVRANVSGATVYLDGEQKGLAPVTIDDLQPGRYTVRVTKDGYEPYEERVMVSPDKQLEVWAHLERVVTTGSISLSGTPEGAKVYLDGYYSGTIPCTIEQVEPGRHTLTVKKTGYQDWEEKVRVAAGEMVQLEANLEKEVKRVVESGPGAKRFTNSIGMEFVSLPAGEFEMGSPLRNLMDRGKDERYHKVTMSKPFYMQATEVTQGHWEAVMGDNPSYFNDCGGDCPVERVSWDDCQEFIRRLNQMEGTDKYRLPTEAEWEYACRAGSTSRFCFGDSDGRLGEYAWYFDNSDGRPHPVRQMKANAWGLYDMHGNVWEWCQDWYKKQYPRREVTDPKGPFLGSHRVRRGGSWDDAAWNCRSATRSYGLTFHSSYILGFRLVRSLD